ncbi:MAG: prepilin-type N-terminal cleavage/methylation domain-containing protein [Patescibacteria group bacterium]
MNGNKSARRPPFGFTLVEVLVYAIIFAITAGLLVSVLTIVTRTQVKQTSANELNDQLSFVASTIQQLVRQASEIGNDPGVASTTLILRTSSSSLDKTFIYASGTTLYLEQGSASVGLGTAVPLTSEKVSVNNFSITKYENPGGLAVVQVNLTLTSVNANPQNQISRVWQSAIARVTAATFDSGILPNAGNSFDIGGITKEWRNGYFLGTIGIGTSPIAGAGIKSTQDLQITNSAEGLVLTRPDGQCGRITLNASGNLATSSPFTCP